MSKARITVTFEYEVKSDYYPSGMDLAEMVQMDVANYQDDMGSMLDVMQSYELTVSGEIVDEEGGT